MRTPLLMALLLAGCAETSNLPVLSAQTPPNASRNSEPEPVSSLPPGAGAPNGEPNFFSLTFGRRG